ncbi:hypothetical protein PHYBOEH_004886 [Phytophthora boehmeriae]|uniref:Importin N-terminal domain-containing protein n=1 Tax=Phytophthora boehmeriae TaxID=109152 RepID=A0A8T1XA35_9STRA|nr:hypothetical protein PHYBOEH_004886 [Phytophthora boehmeriae]
MVLSAVQALYGMEGADRQREANEFLNAFAASEAAWAVTFQLLQDETLNLPPEALFFAANMLHTKVRKEWARLSTGQKAAMTASLQTLMDTLRAGNRPGFHQGPLASKLCAIYAVALISSPDDCRALLSQLVAICSATGNPGEITFLLALSRCVCEEMEDAEIAFAAKDAMEMNLSVLSGDVVTLLGKIILTREDQDSRVAALHGEALSCLKVWIRRAGLSLASLFSQDEAVLLALLEALQSKSPHLVACADILNRLISVAAYPTPIELEKTLLVVAQGLLKTRTACESALVAEEDEVSHALTDVISTFCETFLVASVQTFSATAEQEAMPIENRLLVVEGLVRAAAVSPHCSVILQAVLDDSLTRLDQVLAATSCDDTAVAALVCNELQVLGKIVRFLDAPADEAGGTAITAWAVQLIWPHLDALVLRLEADEAVMTALFQLYGWCLQSLQQEMAPQLGGIATLIVKVFEQRRFVAPLECASVAVDVFGKGGSADPQIVDNFRGLMGALSQSAFHFFTTHSLAESPEVLRSFFELAYRFLLFCPAAILSAAEFPMLIELSLACVGNQDRTSTNAVLMFLTFLLNESTIKLAAFTPIINASVLDAGQTEKWFENLVSALAMKSPSVLYDAVAKLLFALLSSFPGNERVRTVLTQVLTRDSLGVTVLTPEDRQQVLHLWLSLAAEPSRYSERRFRGVCSDFAKVCRKEMTADSLHSFEVPS